MAGYTLRLVRTKQDAADDADPNIVPPLAADLFVSSALRPDSHTATIGFRGKLVFTVPAGNTANIEVWIRNETDSTWAFAGVLAAVPDSSMFIYDDAGDAVIYFRLTGITAGNPIAVWAEEA